MVGGARWNRGLAALARLYEWAVQREYALVNPVLMRSVVGLRRQLFEGTDVVRALHTQPRTAHTEQPVPPGLKSDLPSRPRRAARPSPSETAALRGGRALSRGFGKRLQRTRRSIATSSRSR
jgi:hypothetical protein